MEPKLFDTCGLQGHSLELIMENQSDTPHSQALVWAFVSEYDFGNNQLPAVSSKQKKIK